jgi:hypothetical protein
MIVIEDILALVDTHITNPELKKSITTKVSESGDLFDACTILRKDVVTSSHNDETGDEKVVALAALVGVSDDKKLATEDITTGLKYINKYWREQ